MINLMRIPLHNNLKHSFSILLPGINHMINIKHLIFIPSILHHKKHSNINNNLCNISPLLTKVVKTCRVNGMPKEPFESHCSNSAYYHEKWTIHYYKVSTFHIICNNWIIILTWFSQFFPKLISKATVALWKLF